MTDFKRAQNEDSDIHVVLSWLKDGDDPALSLWFKASSATKSYSSDKEVLCQIDEVLCRTDPESEEKLFLLPESLSEQTVSHHRDLPLAGYQGEYRTHERMKDIFYWY